MRKRINLDSIVSQRTKRHVTNPSGKTKQKTKVGESGTNTQIVTTGKSKRLFRPS